MAPFLFLLFLSGAASDQTVVPVHPGDDVTLPCQSAGSSISVVKWSRADLEPPEYVLLYSDGHLKTYNQHPSFKDRVDLVDRDLKDGDVSLTLKNVSRHDAGIYTCGVIHGDSRRKKRDTDSDLITPIPTIRTVCLQVTEPAVSNIREDEDRDGNSSPVCQYRGLAAVSVAAGVVLLAAVVGVLIYRGHKNKRSGQPAAAADEALAVQFINT
ncbi:hepatitis A virus cellular receptor 1-like [Perca flavescens]|uniref:hepatitis A virus cellular receptor 1-like n=1 Tax=Perca flavescens TaxID=8167 RepID=UPI00106EAA42|nr:hepatitis A virus cellular receptor 1-like [Perca flavescens]